MHLSQLVHYGLNNGWIYARLLNCGIWQIGAGNAFSINNHRQ